MVSTSSNTPTFKIILGSSSPARRAILSDMGYDFTVMVGTGECPPLIEFNSSSPDSADIDEKAIRRDKPEELVKALAEAKADAIQLNLRYDSAAADGDCSNLPTLLITSDQVKVSKGVIRERPRSTEEAREFIKGYSGDRAFAVNYVLVTNLTTGGRKGGWDIPELYFHHIPDEFVEKMVNEGGMTCVAGGLRLMHPSASPFIKELVSKLFQTDPTSKSSISISPF